MLKKTVLSILIGMFLVLMISVSVTADSESESLDDDVGDVVDIDTGETVSGIKDIDITKLTYARTNKDIDIEVEFADIIEESPEISIIVELQTNDYYYYIFLADSGSGFESFGLYSDLEDESMGDLFQSDYEGFGTNKITFSFELIDKYEEYKTISVTSSKITDTSEYMDQAPEITLDITIDSPTTGKVGENIEFYGNAEGGSGEYFWAWYFTNEVEAESEEQNPTFIYEEPGTYVITLEVFDKANILGSVSSVNTTITISNATVVPDNPSDDEGSSLILFIVIIAVIVIAGIAALVYISRR